MNKGPQIWIKAVSLGKEEYMEWAMHHLFSTLPYFKWDGKRKVSYDCENFFQG